MALAGTHVAAAQAKRTAENAVKATWLALNRVLTPAEIEQMKLEVEAAGIAAIFAHISANAQVNGTAAPGLTSATGGVVTGQVILPAGSIV